MQKLFVGRCAVQGSVFSAASGPLGTKLLSGLSNEACSVNDTSCGCILTGHLGDAGGRCGASGGPGRGRGAAGGHARGRLPAQRLHPELAAAWLLLPRRPASRGVLVYSHVQASLQPEAADCFATHQIDIITRQRCSLRFACPMPAHTALHFVPLYFSHYHALYV